MMRNICFLLSALCIGLGFSATHLNFDLDATVIQFAATGATESEFVFVYAMTIAPSSDISHSEKWDATKYLSYGLLVCAASCDATVTVGECAKITLSLLEIQLTLSSHTATELNDIKSRVKTSVDAAARQLWGEKAEENS